MNVGVGVVSTRNQESIDLSDREERRRTVRAYIKWPIRLAGIGLAAVVATGCTTSTGSGNSAPRSSSAAATETLDANRPHHCLAGDAEGGPQTTELCLYDDGSGEAGIFKVAEPHTMVQKLKITDKAGQLCIDSLPGDKPVFHVCPEPFTPPFQTASPTS